MFINYLVRWKSLSCSLVKISLPLEKYEKEIDDRVICDKRYKLAQCE